MRIDHIAETKESTILSSLKTGAVLGFVTALAIITAVYFISKIVLS